MTVSDELLNKQFLDMLEQHSNIIIKVSRAYTVVAQDREDLMNDIALELWKSFRSFRGECKVSTWMYRVSLNTAMNFSRKNKRSRTLFFENGIPPETYVWMSDHSDESQTDLLYKCIDELSALNKAIVLLYLDKHNHEEISAITGISKTNVGTRILRIKDELKSIANNYKD